MRRSGRAVCGNELPARDGKAEVAILALAALGSSPNDKVVATRGKAAGHGVRATAARGLERRADHAVHDDGELVRAAVDAAAVPRCPESERTSHCPTSRSWPLAGR